MTEAINASTKYINKWHRKSAYCVVRARPVLVHTFQDSHLKPTALHVAQGNPTNVQIRGIEGTAS